MSDRENTACRLSTRPLRADDAPFLALLFRDALGPTAAALAALPDGGAALLGQMREGQLRSWREAFGEAGHRVVLIDGQPAGRLWTARLGEAELRLVDIALLAAHRGRGLGTALLRGVLDGADGEGRTVVLHVARGNPALRLYRRLGFEVTGEDAVHLRLEHAPR